MTITVEFASVLAHITPVFLLMVMFERITVDPPAGRWQASTALLIRHAATLLCLLVLAASLLIVSSGSPLTGWTAGFIGAAIIILLVLLWFTINGLYDAARERIANVREQTHGGEDQPHNEQDRDK